MKPLEIPSGYGFIKTDSDSWNTSNPDSCMDRLMIWEPPRKFKDGSKRQDNPEYIISVDVSTGLGIARSVAAVWRLGTVSEPDEQVAQFITDQVEAVSLAAYLDAIGRFYSDGDGTDALMAIECNNQGIGTQAELQGHYGYSNFFVWEKYDARNPANRFSRAIGWWTTSRTRPLIIARLVKAIRSYVEPDPANPARVIRSTQPDCIINSPFTIEELQDFQVGANGRFDDARAYGNAHDDCLMAVAIALHVCQTRHFLEREPINEQRRRQLEERETQDALAARLATRRDYINTEFTIDEMRDGELSDSSGESDFL